MGLLEKFKLYHRAFQYWFRDDPAEIRYLQSCLKKGDVAMDIGAHKGGYTFWMRQLVGSSGRVIAFEPQKAGAELLHQLFQQPNVIIEQIALSDTETTTTLFIQPQANRVSFEASLVNKYPDAVPQEVSSTTLDIYLSRHRIIPAFIKIDVEGHERAVLEGGRQILYQHHPVLLVEAEERHTGKEGLQELFQFLKSLGYNGYFFFNGK
jgi:FkbM family methyltransferase